MKYMIASDLHGNVEAVKQLFTRIIFERPDKLILLGDLYYHGPRNKLPDSYNPMELSELLNNHADIIVAIRGNCDAQVDEMISQFKFLPDYSLEVGGKKILLTHGHDIDQEKIFLEYDVLICGHTHVGLITQDKFKKITANCGSVGLPKNNSKQSFLILDSDSLTLKDFSGKTIESIKI